MIPGKKVNQAQGLSHYPIVPMIAVGVIALWAMLPVQASEMSARKWLQMAVREYKSGQWQAAQRHLKIALGREDALSLTQKPERYQLELLLELYRPRSGNTSKILRRLLELQPSAFWSYYYATLLIRDHHYQQAAGWYQKALQLGQQESPDSQKLKKTTDKQPVSEWFYSEAPASCHWQAPQNSLLPQALPSPFAQSRDALNLWNRDITPAELQLAWYYATLYNHYFKLKMSLPTYSQITQRLTKSELDKHSQQLLENPLSDQSYADCLKNLKYQYNEDLNGTHLRPYDRQKLDQYRLQMHINRYQANPTHETRTELARHYLAIKQPHAALNLIRSAWYSNTGILLQNNTRYLKELNEKLQLLSLCYEQLNQSEDHLSVSRLQQLLNQALSENDMAPKHELSTKQFTQLKRSLLERAGANRFNLESLYLLLSQTSNSEKRRAIQKQIQSRNESMELTELPEAFGWMRVASKSHPN